MHELFIVNALLIGWRYFGEQPDGTGYPRGKAAVA